MGVSQKMPICIYPFGGHINCGGNGVLTLLAHLMSLPCMEFVDGIALCIEVEIGSKANDHDGICTSMIAHNIKVSLVFNDFKL